MSPKAEKPVTIRGMRLTERQLIPIARALGWEEPDPYNNKSIVAFLRKLIDHCYDEYVTQSNPVDREMEKHVAAFRLVAAYAEGLKEVPVALLPAVEIAEKFSSA
jgi:hypothetical protein